MRYGGNTSCVEVRLSDDTLIILDAGTGIRALGQALLAQPGPVHAHLFLSHAHWDHIQGIPFFTPAYVAGTELTILGPEHGQLTLEKIVTGNDARLINTTSVSGIYGNPGQTNYAASKGAINSFTRALAVELASRGVTVNAIAPGFIETDMSEAVRNKAGDLIKKMIPMRRLGQPQDIARVAVFLASEEAGYITGQVLGVNGGAVI
jgi:NAD(P)-dependent dehydrogenase (short-subunit alcohol dehydrogenase family)